MKKNRGLWFWWLVFSLLIILSLWLIGNRSKINLPFSGSQPGLYSVARFVDGDTIDVNMNGRIETVRLIGIDTPETHKPDTPVQCYGREAAEFTKKLIGSQKVRLQADSLDTNRDRYGRLLRYVYLPDGRLVEQELLLGGYAFAYTQFPFERADQFTNDEGQAKLNRRGLWAACQVMVEADGRKQTNPVTN